MNPPQTKSLLKDNGAIFERQDTDLFGKECRRVNWFNMGVQSYFSKQPARSAVA